MIGDETLKKYFQRKNIHSTNILTWKKKKLHRYFFESHFSQTRLKGLLTSNATLLCEDFDTAQPKNQQNR